MKKEPTARMQQTQKRGFTLIELFVVIGIFLVIISVTILSQRSFDNSILIDNLAYGIALAVREAQVYGVSTRGFDTDFTSSYGVHFDTNEPNRFVLFADRDSIGRYDGDSINDIEIFTLGTSGQITDVCRVEGGAVECGDTTGVDVSFIRPNPEPAFFFYDNDGNYDDDLEHSGAVIELTSPGGRVKTVQIGVTGQIVVE
ncbi:MAG: type II secretion system protein [Candidatus Paceibacterota bacterium]